MHEEGEKVPNGIPCNGVALGFEEVHDLLLLLSAGGADAVKRQNELFLHAAFPLGHDGGGFDGDSRRWCVVVIANGDGESGDIGYAMVGIMCLGRERMGGDEIKIR